MSKRAEIWKPLYGFEGRYEISDMGHVRNVKRNSIVKSHIDAHGYLTCTLRYVNEEKSHTVRIHRAIALAFIPNPNNLPEVDHLDFNRNNYSISNLRWISHEDNVRRSVCNKPDVSGMNNPNYGNRKLGLFYKEHPEIAKQKQSRPGKQNGRYVDGRYMSEKV